MFIIVYTQWVWFFRYVAASNQYKRVFALIWKLICFLSLTHGVRRLGGRGEHRRRTHLRVRDTSFVYVVEVVIENRCFKKWKSYKWKTFFVYLTQTSQMDNSAWKCYCDRLRFSLRIGTFFLRNVPSGDEQEKTAVLAGYLKLFEPRSCFQFSKINEYSYFTHACTKPTKFQATRFCKTTLHLRLLVLWEWTTCGHWDFRTCACLVKASFKILA